ncbi:hypothetical protein, partial [Escherichia coli]|uniref:hypothetical protein n=1 Tax=Escherichia coli TaxID=562 RepID=UPI001BC8A58C
CSLLAPSDAILFQEGVSVKLRLPQMSVGDIKFTFIIILLLLCVVYKSAHVMISVDTMWLSVSLPGHA